MRRREREAMRERGSKSKSLATRWAPGVLMVLSLALGAGPAAAVPPSPGPEAGAPAEAKAAPVDRQVLEEVVDKALERQLAPVKEMLTELTVHRTSLTDILGGLGYILGIFGIWAYCLSKRKPGS